MAKRRRLMPARGLELDAGTAARFARETSEPPQPREAKSGFPASLPPIAAMAGDIAGRAAIDEMALALETARTEGRLAEALPLEAVVDDHLIRDRGQLDPEEMEALTASLRARGQQVPIEVEPLGDGRFGLISGWRRLTALRRLAAAGEGPGRVVAFLRHPEASADAYLAMIEENEIRADLGFWERGRVVARAVEAGVFPDMRAALLGLFGAVPRARRSKVGSFAILAQRLDGVLAFPQALTEKLGLALAQRLKAAGDDGDALVADLRAALDDPPPETAAEEAARLEAWLSPRSDPARSDASRADPSDGPETHDPAAGLRVTFRGRPGRRRATLSGAGVDAALEADLLAWLEGRPG